MQIYKKLYKNYVNKYKRTLLLSIIFTIISAISTAIMAYSIKPAINKVFINKSYIELYYTFTILMFAVCIKAIVDYFQSVLVHILHEKVISDLRQDLFKKMIFLNMQAIHKLKNGEFMTYFLNDVQTVGYSLYDIFVSMTKDFFTTIFLVILIFYQDFKLALIAFIILPLIVLPLAKIAKNLKNKYLDSQECYDIASSKLSDIMNGIKTIKAYNAERFEIIHFKRILLNVLRTSIKFKKKGSLASPIMEFVTGLSIGLVILYGGFAIINNKSDVGSFFSFITALIMVYRPIKAISNVNVKVQTCTGSLGRIFAFLKISQTENIDDGKNISFANATIEFKNVNFCYRDDKNIDCTILNNINFKIEHGMKVAFVGFSGCGKSTIVNLLLRMYDINSGEILINGININDINLMQLRRNIGYISQDNFIFDNSIKNNIIYNTKKNITDEYLEQIIQMSQIDFLNTLPNGINEHSGYCGNKLSLGQRQRIAIARAVIKDASIIIMDEATSALDVITENKIKNTIFDKMKDKTIIFIAHRLQTIVNCDKIFVMNNANIIEHGTHEELLKKDNFYAKLWFTNK